MITTILASIEDITNRNTRSKFTERIFDLVLDFIIYEPQFELIEFVSIILYSASYLLKTIKHEQNCFLRIVNFNSHLYVRLYTLQTCEETTVRELRVA